MKAIDFTRPGGFPLTQNQLNYLQQAYTECTKALAMMGGNGSTPFIINGVDITSPAPGSYTVTSGWIFYGNAMVRVVPTSVAGAGGGFEAYMVITAMASALTYNDGSTPGVILDSNATLQILPAGTAADATRFPISSLRRFGAGFGELNRETAWNILAVSTAPADGGVTGNVYYKKDFTANTLHIRGQLIAANAQNFAALPATLFYLMGTLPAGYVPGNTVYFAGSYHIASSIKDDVGVAWIKQVNCGINAIGQLFINWIKPDIATSLYGINFNTIVPLD